jgi:hypothetical protein
MRGRSQTEHNQSRQPILNNELHDLTGLTVMTGDWWEMWGRMQDD